MAEDLLVMERATPVAPSADRRRWLVLLALVFGLFMPMLDHLVVNVALPTIQAELGSSISGLQWIVDAYTLAFAALLLTGGALGDRYGRKRVYLIGLAVFTIASGLSGLSTTTAELVATRALQGVGAALLVPGTLSIIAATFEGRERGAAIGIWGGVAGLAIAIGPVVGGLLVEHVSWQSVFFVNVPVGVLALAAGSALIPESRDESGLRQVDVPGLLAITGSITALTFALIEGNARGWTDPAIVGALALAATLVVAFIAVERRSAAPMLPMRLYRNRTFAAANVVAAAVFFGMAGTAFVLALYLQTVRGFSPAQAGLRLFPFSVMILLVSPVAGKISDRRGSRALMTVGPLVVAFGLALLVGADASTPYRTGILPAFLLMGAGWGLTMAPMTSAVMGSVEPEAAGVASAVTNTMREIGGTIGIAAIGALVTAGSAFSSFRSGLWAAIGAMVLASVVSLAFVRSHVDGRWGDGQAATRP